MLAAMNNLEVKCGNVMNAYITAPITEKVWTILGPEFGADQGKKALIVRALYGVKYAGFAFQTHLCICMKGMGYTPCLADPDLWYNVEVRPGDGFEYYSYILCYVDDILVIHPDSLSVLKRVDSYFNLKPASIGDPDIYLGAKVTKMNLANGTWCWTLSPSKYVQEAVRNYEQALKDTYGGTHKLPRHAPNPFPMGYKPEMELTKPIETKLASYYQYLI